MNNQELLKIYRDQIDTLDKEMIYLLSRRFALVKQIGLVKKENNMKPLQEDRWKEVLNSNIEI
jgi:chorismate mutase